MRVIDDRLLLAPTDLGSFLHCRHKAGLDLAVARRALERPRYEDPYAAILQRLGAEHEGRHVDALRSQGLHVVEIAAREDAPSIAARLAAQTADTIAAMQSGADVIVQARLAHETMAGYADILMKVPLASRLGAWSYEAHDTKLARETKGSAVLQLCAYSEMLEHMQGVLPEHFAVVTPDPLQPVQRFRTADYLAYYRMVRASLEGLLPSGHDAIVDGHYPEPVEHCAVCMWEPRCIGRRRADDHLSFIANAGRTHRQELVAQGHPTLTAAAQMPVPVTFRPARGTRATYDRLGHQARVQHEQRSAGLPVFERLEVVPGEGLSRLPEPSAGDLFLDLEGARYAREGGREFLFGLWTGRHGSAKYHAWWATTDEEEKAAFEAVMDRIAAAWQADPGMHVYHFNHYEPTAFKRLVGRHVTRGELMDQLLRAERFVDLYPIVRQSVRCGVESYSIKQLEQYTGYMRQVALSSVSQPLLAVEVALERGVPGDITDDIRNAVQGYNDDDCRSTEALRDWLERLRDGALAEGVDVPRPVSLDGEPAPAVSELQQQVNELRARLLAVVDLLTSDEDEELAQALRTLAYLLDWHRREENADWWEYFRLKELPAEALADERAAIAGLTFVERLGPVIGKTGKPTKSVRDRYAYPAQELEIGRKTSLHARDGKAFGKVAEHDRQQRTIDIEKGPSRAGDHPTEVFAADIVGTKGPQQSVMRIAAQLLDAIEHGHARAQEVAERARAYRGAGACGLALLFRQAPRLREGVFALQPGESATDMAVRVVTALEHTTLPVQGPPGSGKTYAGAHMIRALVKAGQRVGVTATSHKVIRNLLDEVARQAAEAGEAVRLGAKVGEADEQPGDGEERRVKGYTGNAEACAAIGAEVDVLGGTAWLWSREEFAGAVDVLFVDEAGQMSLANVLAVSPAAGSLVLLGDPQQLDQPQKTMHPDGVGVSALQHVLGDADTMPADRGIFLPVTYRMAPDITAFTSELFYASQLESAGGLERQALAGAGRFDGAGLWLIEVPHDTNQTSAPEEVDAVAALVRELLGADDAATWVDASGQPRPLTAADFRVVAPFNAQVNRLTERLGPLGVPVGTVDRFQGQTAAAVIYSMTTSRPEDAPRGLEFLYSLNRLNVATSRARCAVFVVCSPHLLRPDCRTPRQMALANALCRYAELARRVGP